MDGMMVWIKYIIIHALNYDSESAVNNNYYHYMHDISMYNISVIIIPYVHYDSEYKSVIIVNRAGCLLTRGHYTNGAMRVKLLMS